MRCFTVLMGALVSSSALAGPDVHVVRTLTGIDLVDAATNTEVSVGSSFFATDSLAIDPSGTLYSADASGNLFQVGSAPIPVGPTGFQGIGDLDYGSGGLWGFSNASSTLFFFDLNMAAVSYSVSLPSLATYTITGVAYRPDDSTIYLAGNTGLNQDTLFSVGASSNVVSTIGAMANGDTPSYFSDIDFDANDTLYATSWFHRDFYTVNRFTGATALYSSGPHRDVTGMAIQAVPEPAALGALAIGLLTLYKRRRH